MAEYSPNAPEDLFQSDMNAQINATTQGAICPMPTKRIETDMPSDQKGECTGGIVRLNEATLGTDGNHRPRNPIYALADGADGAVCCKLSGTVCAFEAEDVGPPFCIARF